MGGASIWHWIVVGVIIMLLFGRGKVSDLMGDVAKGIKAFKKGMADDEQAPASTAQVPHAQVPRFRCPRSKCRPRWFRRRPRSLSMRRPPRRQHPMCRPRRCRRWAPSRTSTARSAERSGLWPVPRMKERATSGRPPFSRRPDRRLPGGASSSSGTCFMRNPVAGDWRRRIGVLDSPRGAPAHEPRRVISRVAPRE